MHKIYRASDYKQVFKIKYNVIYRGHNNINILLYR